MGRADPRHHGWIGMVADYGPLAVFFLVYRHYAPPGHADAVREVFAVIRGTVGFMLAAVAALVVSRWQLGRISPMLWLSTALIVGFGSLTIFFHDPVWIQIKPTAIYTLFGVALLVGVWRGTPLLKVLLGPAFEGLSETGWLLLSRNWGWFFLFLALLNEGVRHYLTFGQWLAAKLWLFLPLPFLFTFAHVPLLLRHGLGEEPAPPGTQG